jgi:DNA-binding GntR family transcriptional regulator
MDAFRGASFHTLTLTELEDIYEMRAALILLALNEELLTVTNQELDQAEVLLRQMEARNRAASMG